MNVAVFKKWYNVGAFFDFERNIDEGPEPAETVV
jgi:hypothetical protein